jgi:GNAT superfamily N-acetyltransferase
VIDLGFVDESEVDRGATRDALRRAGLQSHRRVRDQAPFVRLPGSYEAYMAQRKPKWRENLRRCVRTSSRLRGVTYQRYIPPPGRSLPRWDLYDACEEVARRSWQGSSTAGTTICHESIRPFLRGVHEVASRLGAADINLLWLDGEPAAFAYNYHWRGYVFGLRMGYDPRWRHEGIGTLLLDHIVRDSIRRGFHTFDLGPGSLDAKRHVQTGVKPVVQYSHYRPGAPRAQLLRMKHFLAGLVEQPSEVGF